MIKAIYQSIEQFTDSRVLMVLLKSAVLSLIACVGFAYGLSKAVQWGLASYGYGDDFSAVITTIITVFIVIFAFRAVAIPITGFFADEIVAAVEARHYPQAAGQARPVSFAVSMRLAVMSVVRLIGVNILMIPVYIFLMFTIIGAPIAFFCVNAVLVGRDMGEMVAVRHLEREPMKRWLGQNRFQRAVLGMITTFLYTLPILNIVATILGAAMATHVFHQAKGKP
jgi:CysZ protein